MSRPDRPADTRYRAHLAVCEAVVRGGWCRSCVELIREADAEDWRPVGAGA